MHLRTLPLVTSMAVAAATVVVVASPAQAATAVSNAGGTLTVRLSSPTDLLIEPVEAGVRVESGEGLGSVTGCGEDDFGMMVCPGVTRVVVHGTSGPDSIDLYGDLDVEVRAGAGDDDVYASDGVSLVAFGDAGNDEIHGGTGRNQLDGGIGNDEVHGGSGNDTVSGGPGNDRISGDWGDDVLDGGPGNDKLIGDFAAGVPQPEDGDDVLDGGDGDDHLLGMGGGDTYRGGPGIDIASYEGQYLEQTGLTFSATLDGVANDGVTGEGDNLDPDGSVEDMQLPTFGIAHMTVIGNDGPNNIDAHATKTLVVDGRGGDDTLLVGAVGPGSHADVKGGSGNDSITSHGETSTVDGGPGNDRISSGDGDDTVTGGTGTDSISGGAGSDTIDSVDDAVDTVSCGSGGDVLRADRIDVVDASATAVCERTTLVGEVPEDPDDSGEQPADPGRVMVRIPRRVRVSRRGVARFRAGNTYDHAVTLKVVAKNKKFRIGTGRRTLAADSTGKVKLKLTKRARRYLRRHHKMTGKVTFRVVRGSTGKVSRRVRFRMR